MLESELGRAAAGSVALLGISIGLAFVVGQCGCSPAAAAAEAAYTTEQLRCVDEAKTLEESQACRRKVRERWGIVETVSKDGGR